MVNPCKTYLGVAMQKVCMGVKKKLGVKKEDVSPLASFCKIYLGVMKLRCLHWVKKKISRGPHAKSLHGVDQKKIGYQKGD